MPTDYPAYYEKLQKLTAKLTRELRGPMAGFTQLRVAATAAGALDLKTKQLVAALTGICTAPESVEDTPRWIGLKM